MESSHLVIFSTSGKFIMKFNVLRCISFSETQNNKKQKILDRGKGSNTNHLNSIHNICVGCN